MGDGANRLKSIDCVVVVVVGKCCSSATSWISFSEGEFKTSHYAICTAFMALSMLLPGMVAGYIQEAIGYVNFFWMVMVCCIATLIVTFFADKKIDPNYGKK